MEKLTSWLVLVLKVMEVKSRLTRARPTLSVQATSATYIITISWLHCTIYVYILINGRCITSSGLDAW